MSLGPLRILLLDDNPHDRELTLRELQKEFPRVEVNEPIDEEQFQRAVVEADYELVITDYQLRWTTGVQVVRTVKDTRPHCPVIMFTATGTQEVAVEAMKAGLDDYVIKSPKHYIRLAAAVRSCLDRAEIRLRALRSETRLHTLLNRLNVGVFRMSLEGELAEANRAGQKILERFGSAQAQASANGLMEATRSILPELRKRNDAVERELRLEAVNGETLSIYLSLLRVQLNGVDAIDGLVEDLTRMYRVVQRSTQLEEANRALEAFAFTVSHDLREPLRNLQGYVRALQEDFWDGLPEKGREYVVSMGSIAARMDGLIADVLEFSRLSSAELPVERVFLGEAVQEALNLMQNAAERSGATIQVADSVQLEVLGHHQTILQVLTNLLSNSLKFVAEGERPGVRIWAEQRGGRWVRLWVDDDGIGIAPEHRKHIFEVFQRLHGEEKYPGSGVGLALVRKGVERMGGQVGVESTSGDGSRFWIELKRAD